MEINRLLSEELVYELKVRGLPVGTVAENRATLRGAFRLERDGITSGTGINISLCPQDELDICLQKLNALTSDIENFNYFNKDNECKRIYSRLCHIQGRLRRITVVNGQMEQIRNDYLGRCLMLIDALCTIRDAVSEVRCNHGSLLEDENRLEGSIMDQGNLLLPEIVTSQASARMARSEEQGKVLTFETADRDERNSTMVQMGLNVLEELGEVRNRMIQENTQMEDLIRSNNHIDKCTRARESHTNDVRTDASRTRISHQGHQHFGRSSYSSEADRPVDDHPTFTNLPRDPQGTHPAGLQKHSFGEMHDKFSNLQRPSYAQNPPNSYHQIPFVDVSRWKVQYDGESSVTNFLERVEELRVSRGVTKELLLRSAPELFTKEALIWFRTQQFRSWDELTERLRANFQPYDYEFDLMEEIRRRTQGTKERVVTYIAAMENLFNKLGSTKPSEWTRVKLIRRNLLPYLQTQLALESVETVSELIRLCRTIEETAVRSQKYMPPPTNYRQLLEPELAYHKPTSSILLSTPLSSVEDQPRREQPSTSTVVRKSEDSSTIKATCWNCKKTGHRFRNCPQPKSIFCFRCGNSNVIASECPNCQSKNAARKSQYAG